MRRTVACGLAVVAVIAFRPITGMAAPQKVACSLLTTEQVIAALGPVGPAKAMTKQTCQWTQQGKGGGDPLKLELSVTTLERYNRFKTAQNATITAVSGLGDEAYYSTQSANAAQTALCVRKGETALIIHVFGGKEPTAQYQSQEKAIAEALLPGL
jgi:hypothetical protein